VHHGLVRSIAERHCRGIVGRKLRVKIKNECYFVRDGRLPHKSGFASRLPNTSWAGYGILATCVHPVSSISRSLLSLSFLSSPALSFSSTSPSQLSTSRLLHRSLLLLLQLRPVRRAHSPNLLAHPVNRLVIPVTHPINIFIFCYSPLPPVGQFYLFCSPQLLIHQSRPSHEAFNLSYSGPGRSGRRTMYPDSTLH
jgi:hypothetical protein